MIYKNSLDLFKKASSEIEAYQKFLKLHKFDPKKVETIEALNIVPFTTKETYLKRYSKEQLVWPKDWKAQMMFCTTSGSTGEPYYFPRSDELNIQASKMAEEFINNSSRGHTSTLVIMGFGMGVWIGGLITLEAFVLAAKRLKANVAFLPAGYNRNEIIKALKNLSPDFDQTILAGYPPFIKELIDEASDEEINLKKLNMRFVFAAEAFTETFREFVSEKAGVKDSVRDTMNIYGTADIGAMAHETPLSISIRKIAVEDEKLYHNIFGQIEKTPTLAQFNPDYIEFEAIKNKLVVTGNSALPLIRYSLGDNGGVITYDDMKDILKNSGKDIEKIQNQSKAKFIKKRPFVFVYERSNLSASLHGINIYPEYIKEGLYKVSAHPYVTGRFTIQTNNDKNQNQYLEVNIELKKNIEKTPEIKQSIFEGIKHSMLQKSSEFREINKSYAASKLIKVVLWPQGYDKYFSPNTKQKWVEKA